MILSGPECGPECPCGERVEMSFRCVSILPDGSRCGHVSGPFGGVREYKAQGGGHFIEFDDEDAMVVAVARPHGHDKPNYSVPHK